MAIEKMDEFFASRIEEYDEYMLTNVVGCKEGYEVMAKLIPKQARSLLDLGCGTGLELDFIFRLMPKLKVVGIDMTRQMLDKLTQKHGDKEIKLICGDYFKTELGENTFDCAVSFETMHHFNMDMKTKLYRKIYDSLCEKGCYIECDYMVQTQQEQDELFAQYEKLCKEENLDENEFYHFDTPCSVENQMKILLEAGFSTVEQMLCVGGTVILKAQK